MKSWNPGMMLVGLLLVSCNALGGGRDVQYDMASIEVLSDGTVLYVGVDDGGPMTIEAVDYDKNAPLLETRIAADGDGMYPPLTGVADDVLYLRGPEEASRIYAFERGRLPSGSFVLEHGCFDFSISQGILYYLDGPSVYAHDIETRAEELVYEAPSPLFGLLAAEGRVYSLRDPGTEGRDFELVDIDLATGAAVTTSYVPTEDHRLRLDLGWRVELRRSGDDILVAAWSDLFRISGSVCEKVYSIETSLSGYSCKLLIRDAPAPALLCYRESGSLMAPEHHIDAIDLPTMRKLYRIF